MELVGERHIALEPLEVWRALNDVEVLRQSIPGCKEMTGSVEEGYEAVVTQKIGPVKATFRGRVELSDIVEGRSYRISGSGKGGPAGHASGAADVRLDAHEDGGTRLIYAVEARVGGKIASLGGRLIGGVARKLADKFFENFQNAVENARASEQDGVRDDRA